MSQSNQIVRVALGARSYDISVGANNLDQFAGFVLGCGPANHAVIVTDENVQRPYAMEVAECLGGDGVETAVVAIEPGEESKSIEMASNLWQALLDLHADRKSLVVAVGGGVVGDLAGFIAATYARGLRFFQVPTTLLAQVDSSVGGKTAIDLPAAKNIIGAFYQPSGVWIDAATLASLPEKEYRAGLGEVVKYGVILDADFFVFLENNVDAIVGRDADALTEVIARCCRLKADVVEKDEREETGLRAVLNYGHTFGHAFETLSGYGNLLHGEGVAIGMCCAARLAARLGRVDEAFVSRQRKLLEALGLPVATPDIPAEKILESMRHDKKTAFGKLRFVLPDRLGHVELVGDVNEDDVVAALKE